MTPAAALVHYHRASPAIRLVPITVTDFYALPDLRPLGCEKNPAGHPQGRPEHVCARPAVGVPTAGAILPAGEDGAGGCGGRAHGLAREEERQW